MVRNVFSAGGHPSDRPNPGGMEELRREHSVRVVLVLRNAIAAGPGQGIHLLVDDWAASSLLKGLEFPQAPCLRGPNLFNKLITTLLLTAGMVVNLSAQENFFSKWERRTSQTQSKQPAWSVPLIAPYPMLIQVFRADFTRQITPARTDTWNYGASRGLNLVPGLNSEIDFYYPPYIQHNAKGAKDGFGDVGFLYKYRIFSRNESHGNAMVSAQLTATIPTGSYSNGSTDAAVSPTLLTGKGFGKFDVISCAGGTLPTGDTAKLGRTVAWNTTVQYKIRKFFWPEIEDNATYFFGGKNDGKTQNFVTPGITFSKLKFHPDDPKSRPGIAFGAGEQIATSTLHTYNHNLVLTARLVF